MDLKSLPLTIWPAIFSPGCFVYFAPLGSGVEAVGVPPGVKFRHRFCGPPRTKGAECPNCRKPLLHFLTIDTTDAVPETPFQLPHFIPLLFCWTCNVAHCDGDLLFHIEGANPPEPCQGSHPLLAGIRTPGHPDGCGPFYYRLMGDDGIVLLQYGLGGVASDFPYPAYPSVFPESGAWLLPLTDVAQQIISRLNRGEREIINYGALDISPYGELDQVHHQIGGEPFLVQENFEDSLACPVCRETMPFLANIGDACLDPAGLIGYDAVQVIYHFCAQCRVVGAYQLCD